MRIGRKNVPGLKINFYKRSKNKTVNTKIYYTTAIENRLTWIPIGAIHPQIEFNVLTTKPNKTLCSKRYLWQFILLDGKIYEFSKFLHDKLLLYLYVCVCVRVLYAFINLFTLINFHQWISAKSFIVFKQSEKKRTAKFRLKVVKFGNNSILYVTFVWMSA